MYNAITRKVRCAAAAQGFLLSRGGMEPMKPVFFVLFCFVFFYPAFAFSLFTLVNYVRERKRKIFPFLRLVSSHLYLHAFPFVFVSLV